MPAPVIVWFRQDLRLADNPALSLAAASGAPVIPLFVLEEGGRPLGGASRWWLHHALARLAGSLAALGSPLVLRRGEPAAVLDALIAETGADTVLWNRRYEPDAVAVDSAIKAGLRERGLTVRSHNAALLFEPWEIRNKSGDPFRVFTPFWRACLGAPPPPRPLPAPVSLTSPAKPVTGDALDGWGLPPTKPDWAGGLREAWVPGEAAAREGLLDFLDGPVATYGGDRDRPGIDGTSRLSPHLRFGEIGPRQVWHAARHAADARPGAAPGVDAFLREIGWREFSVHLLHANPGLPDTPLDPRFAAFPWTDDAAAAGAWRRGRTGYPIVDAGMRQLWETGWMHNRVRMIAASFLIKDLLQPWQTGEAWFWDTLVDADAANNAAGWQWVAGCGADAAPFFRVFNPILQGEKFDPDGAYVRRFVPELAKLPDAWIHKPWQAPPAVLCAAGVTIGRDYPAPIIDHALARDRALAAFKAVKGEGG
ncbi:deoxyribodipyrimidine photo-lyase [Azospirillum sp. RWY-5-1]|uniref:Deoxyribodipyrimidine photo-lyase n=1 Tax=Azospirillum oleiclasticum TaxID=2735135 RepID=A0ABX2TCV0_9PROT|nr:deoxyribodipyrimidine photo-lyase [Azospirillum oleiclasticum]NYZ15729.1 deoxyribodipyrimidine photo-lyase [Azospirillum oleiclasticum]NYZ21999.1 deoxyribodipyrimidine photo-lyase [Azospirillum oleiclasticum]